MGKYVILSDYTVWPWSEDCLTTLDDMCIVKDTDDHKKRFFYIIPCVDYDKYDASLAAKERRSERPTVDGIVGIAPIGTDEPRALLVELRFNYTTDRHFDIDNIQSKVANSTRQLRIDGVPNIHPTALFVFSNDMAVRAKRRFDNKSKETGYESLSNYWPVSAKAVVELIGSAAFTPEIDPNDIKESLMAAYHTGGVARLESTIRGYWYQKMSPYLYRKELNECKSILKAIQEALDLLIPQSKESLDYLSYENGRFMKSVSNTTF